MSLAASEPNRDVTADQQDSGGVNAANDVNKAKQECMFLHANNNWQSFPRSSHEGGIFVCLGDGSVRFISDFIESAGAGSCGVNSICNPGTYGTWQKIVASGDGLPVDAGKF